MRYTTHDTVVPRRAFSLALILFFAAASALTFGCNNDEDDVIDIEPALEQEVEDDFPAVSETMEDLDEGDEGMTYIPTTPPMPTDTDESQAAMDTPPEAVILIEPVDTPTGAVETDTPTADATDMDLPPRGAQFDDDGMASPENYQLDRSAETVMPPGGAQFDLDSVPDTGEDDMYGEAVLDDEGQADDFQSVASEGAEMGACAGIDNLDRSTLTLPVELQTALVDPLQYTGLAIDGEVEVLEAVTDRGFWIERPNGERLFVLLKEKNEFDERIHIQDGQRIQLQGVLLSSSAVEILAGDVDPDSRKIIEGLDVFLATPYKNIQILEGPDQN